MAVRPTGYSLEEQIISQIARCFTPDDALAVNATTMCSLVGVALAQRLYAPGLVIQREAMGQMAHHSNFCLPYKPGNPSEDSLEIYLNMELAWEQVFGGKWNIVMQPVQIDQLGNANLSLVGDMTRPKVVFVGSRGLPDNTVNCERVYYVVTEHTKRVFVERVDFISGLGHGPKRKELGINSGAPRKVFSNLGVFDFDEDTGRMRIKSLHTGVPLEDVVGSTGFELIIPESVPETENPSEDEIRLIREEIDPLGMRGLDFAKGEALKELQERIRKGLKHE